MNALKKFEATLAKYKESLPGPDLSRTLQLYKNLVDMLSVLSEDDLITLSEGNLAVLSEEDLAVLSEEDLAVLSEEDLVVLSQLRKML